MRPVATLARNWQRTHRPEEQAWSTNRMCGIAGLLSVAGGERLNDVARRVGAALDHRGPDDGGFYAEDATLLIHRRLAIVDLSAAGHQPITDASGRYVMVYNGEIYNHRELRRRFLASHRFRGGSDTETVLELFAKKGDDAFAYLNGIFALAIWDRHSKTLVLARDGCGVKPLYLYRPATSPSLAFSSEIKALTAIPGFDSPLDPVAAAAYVGFLWSPGERTMFDRVRKFPAGRWQRFDSIGRPIAEGAFYDLPSYAPTPMSAQDAISETERQLSAAVERQMLGDVEVGAFLSGGLDSSAIVHFAQRHAGRPMTCFTLSYDEHAGTPSEMVADLPYARRAAAHLGASLHEVKVDGGIADDLPRLVEMLDEPQADPAALLSYYISIAAREHGIKVLLSGAGGDDVFTGYRRHQQFIRDRLIGSVPAPARAAFARMTGCGGSNEVARKLRKLTHAMQGDADDRLIRAFEWLPLEDAVALTTDGVDAQSVAAPMRAALKHTAGQPAVERLIRLDQQFFLRDHNLNYTDKTGMAAGVEIRVPFLDMELMNWAAQVPLAYKMRGGETKWVLRKALEPHLPRDVIYRPKTGFGVPLRSWMRGPLRDLVHDLTSRAVVTRRDLLDPDAVSGLVDRHYAGRVDAAYPLLAVVMIELWCRRFVDNRETQRSHAMPELQNGAFAST